LPNGFFCLHIKHLFRHRYFLDISIVANFHVLFYHARLGHNNT
jgi:hypothetical protein